MKKIILRAFASGLFIFAATSADARWTIKIHADLPHAGRFVPGPPWAHWKSWTYYITNRYCWAVEGADNTRSRDSWPRERKNVVGPERFSKPPFTIKTDTQSVETDCVAADKSMTINITFVSETNHPLIERTYRFSVTGGGAFAKYRYQLNGEEKARRYLDDAHLCTTIRIHGPEKPDAVETKSGHC